LGKGTLAGVDARQQEVSQARAVGRAGYSKGIERNTFDPGNLRAHKRIGTQKTSTSAV
jgi:hypothetical protein